MKVFVCKKWSKLHDLWEIVKVVSSEKEAELWMNHDKDKDYEECEFEIND